MKSFYNEAIVKAFKIVRLHFTNTNTITIAFFGFGHWNLLLGNWCFSLTRQHAY